MLMSSSTPTECDRLYPELPLAAKSSHRHDYSQQPDRRWTQLRALLGVGLVGATLALALFASHQHATLVTPQSLSSTVHTMGKSNTPLVAADSRSSFRDSLLQAFGLAPESAAEPAPPAVSSPTEELAPPVSLDRKKWNWLSPSGPSFSAIKEPNKDLVTVSAVYKHMLNKRHAQVADAVSELLHAELNYNLTLTCFDKAITNVRRMYQHYMYDTYGIGQGSHSLCLTRQCRSKNSS